MARHIPAHGARIDPSGPTIVFVTVCTWDRRPWLATPEYHDLLRRVWQAAQAWIVGRYVLMPDHLHLFASPGSIQLPLDNWVRYWKSLFRKSSPIASQRWQTDHWDTRLRAGESYDARWEYVRQNPVRAGLVERTEDWPFQGEMNRLPW
jgi:putative transposase